jgi:hypothetical protein
MTFAVEKEMSPETSAWAVMKGRHAVRLLRDAIRQVCPTSMY